MVIIILLYKGIHRAFFFHNECRGFEKLDFICTGHSLNRVKNFSVLKIYSLIVRIYFKTFKFEKKKFDETRKNHFFVLLEDMR